MLLSAKIFQHLIFLVHHTTTERAELNNTVGIIIINFTYAWHHQHVYQHPPIIYELRTITATNFVKQCQL